MLIKLSKSNFRTINIVKNIPVAKSVTVKDNKYYIEFHTEFFHNELKKVIPGKLVYIIAEDLVLSIKRREKIESINS